LIELIELSDGHPLLLRTLLSQLRDHSPSQLLERLQHAGTGNDAMQEKLFTTLDGLVQALADDLQPLLIPLALHRRFVDADYLERMAQAVAPARDRAAIDRLCEALESAGLLQNHGQSIYAIQPQLSEFLHGYSVAAREPDHADAETETAWQRAFADVLSGLADQFAPRPLAEQYPPFYWHGGNFHQALQIAASLNMDVDFAAITQALASYAQNRCDFDTARRYFEQYADHSQRTGNPEHEASAYHQLGLIAQEQDDFVHAWRWYQKSLLLDETRGDVRGAALTCGQLGIIEGLQGHYVNAGRWLIKATQGFRQCQDAQQEQRNVENFLIFYKNAEPRHKAKLKFLWKMARLGTFPKSGLWK
jgi:tetratricopeptide (TPR) repeat protein